MATTSNQRRTPATEPRCPHARRILSACTATAALATILACGNGPAPASLGPNDGDAADAFPAAKGKSPGATDGAAALVLPRSTSTTPMAVTTAQATTVPVTLPPREAEPGIESLLDAKGVLKQIDVSQYETYWFRAPSKNITCLMVGSERPEEDATVRCTIVSKEWRSPEQPDTCRSEWGSDVRLDGNGRPGFVCADDTVLGASITVDYGTRLIMKPGLTCTVTMDGVTCANQFSAAGFLLSRDAYRFF